MPCNETSCIFVFSREPSYQGLQICYQTAFARVFSSQNDFSNTLKAEPERSALRREASVPLFHFASKNILFLLAKLMHLLFSKNIFCFAFKTIPFKPAFLH